MREWAQVPAELGTLTGRVLPLIGLDLPGPDLRDRAPYVVQATGGMGDVHRTQKKCIKPPSATRASAPRCPRLYVEEAPSERCIASLLRLIAGEYMREPVFSQELSLQVIHGTASHQLTHVRLRVKPR